MPIQIEDNEIKFIFRSIKESAVLGDCLLLLKRQYPLLSDAPSEVQRAIEGLFARTHQIGQSIKGIKKEESEDAKQGE